MEKYFSMIWLDLEGSLTVEWICLLNSVSELMEREKEILEVINMMKENEVTIMVLFVNPEVATLFLCTAYEKACIQITFSYFYSVTHEFLVKDASCPSENITAAALQGHIVMFTQQGPDNSSVILDTTGEEYSKFESKYNQEIVRVKIDYFKSHGVPQQLFNPPVLATSLYDQLWGLALAVNSSLPELQRNNISIDALEQHQLTHIIDNHLLNLSFQGAAGYVQSEVSPHQYNCLFPQRVNK